MKTGQVLIDETRQLIEKLAGMDLTLNTYSNGGRVIYTILRISLRADEHAQYEIRVMLKQLWKLLNVGVPLPMMPLSITGSTLLHFQVDVQVIKKMIDGVSIDQESGWASGNGEN